VNDGGDAGNATCAGKRHVRLQGGPVSLYPNAMVCIVEYPGGALGVEESSPDLLRGLLRWPTMNRTSKRYAEDGLKFRLATEGKSRWD
jgi:hypothetical protein